MQVEHPTPGAGGLKEAARPNLKEHMNHARRKRMKSKLGYSATKTAAIMCQEKRNCKKKYRRGVIRPEVEE